MQGKVDVAVYLTGIKKIIVKIIPKLNGRKNLIKSTKKLETSVEPSIDLKKDEDVSTLLKRINQLENNLLNSKLECESARRNSLDLSNQLSQTKVKIEYLTNRLAVSEENIEKIRNTLSFRLGYILIFAFKDWSRFFKLPMDLYELRIEAKRRRISRKKAYNIHQKEERLSPGNNSIPKVKSLSNFDFKNWPDHLKKLRLATIFDDFTYESFKHECNTLQLTPENWQSEITKFKPHIFIAESAWRGKDELWNKKVSGCSKELKEILSWCHKNGIPTAIWNKEDPVHFETFINTIQLFDFVFTTDIDCIPRYKQLLGHERVYLMPFAAQPKLHNPIEKYSRKDAFCFAGSYYVRYPERAQDLGNFIRTFVDYKPIEIYDRRYGDNDSNYQFPDEYKPFIVGKLPFNEIDRAYKGFRYAINLNSIKQSQSMFARRVFELLASNTLVLSNFSRGIKLLFGDLVVSTDNGEEALRQVKQIDSNSNTLAKFKLQALRKVMTEHTYTNRLSYLAEKITNRKMEVQPVVGVFAIVDSKEQFVKIRDSFNSQLYSKKKLFIITQNRNSLENLGDDITFVEKSSNKKLKHFSELDWIALFDSRDYYGENYITDLVIGTKYTDSGVITKYSYYNAKSGELELVNQGECYKYTDYYDSRSSLFSIDKFGHLRLKEILCESNSTSLPQIEKQALSIDEFNYCRDIDWANKVDYAIFSDKLKINCGTSINSIINVAENLQASIEDVDQAKSSSVKVGQILKLTGDENVEINLHSNRISIKSKLPDKVHKYFFSSNALNIDKLTSGKQLKYYFDTSPGLNIQLVCQCRDQRGKKITAFIKKRNENGVIDLPDGTKSILFGIRVYASGMCTVNNIAFDHRKKVVPHTVGSGDYLLITNQYPSYHELYRNGFVHSRVIKYLERNLPVDVFRFAKSNSSYYREFQGVSVTEGYKAELEAQLQTNNYKAILIHFLNADLWEVIEKYTRKGLRTVVWIHGFEIQPWHRREFNYETVQEVENAKREGLKRERFWASLFDSIPDAMQFVFVSKTFAKEVMDDYKVKLPQNSFNIINNPIDTKLFKYKPKSPAHRQRILSIRSFSSHKYANDISINAILYLANHPRFHELTFYIVGNGVLFDKLTEPLKAFPNVRLEKRYLTHQEIAKVQEEFGLFLTPTRWDSQGVSRDEAMSAGLVPLTNSVSAVPEFVDDSCAILAENDGHIALANGIISLLDNPQKFLDMSVNASKRIQETLDSDIIIERECDVIINDN